MEHYQRFKEEKELRQQEQIGTAREVETHRIEQVRAQSALSMRRKHEKFQIRMKDTEEAR